jgi:DNA-binding SARP family transcriptional activator
MAELSIYLFGSVRVLQTGQELLMRPASRMLLLYLLLHRAKYHRREELSTLFWGDTSDTGARRCLNTALWRLRRDVPSTDILNSNLQGDLMLKLQEDSYLDVAEFEDLAFSGLKRSPQVLNDTEIKDLEQAVTVYRGDLAENCFYDWVMPERERLRALYLDSLTSLMQSYSHRQTYPQAIRIGHQILQSDPLREDIHRHLMRLYIASDQRSRALQQYMACWQLLQDELHLTPMPETTALYEQISGKDPLTEITTPVDSIPLRATPLPLHNNLEHLKSLLGNLQTAIQQTMQTIQDLNRSGMG